VPDGIPMTLARVHDPEARVGDAMTVPVDNAAHIHTLAWRWLSEAYPGLAESHNTMH